MKVVFIYSPKDREVSLSEAFLAGVRAAGDEAIGTQKATFKEGLPDGDVYCIVGVKSLKLCEQIKKAGKQFIFFDKGYFRHRIQGGMWEFWRIAVNDHHPTSYVGKAKHSPARWEHISQKRMIFAKPWREEGERVVYAGSSEKYHAFCGLPPPNEYAAEVVKALKGLTSRPLVYRPKPTWDDAKPVKGAAFSTRARSMYQELNNVWCVVTNGSNACFDAAIEGIPSIVLGKAIARSISSTSLCDVEHPRLATNAERNQWFANIAWCMFTEKEMAAGLAWKAIRPQLEGEIFDDRTTKEVAVGPVNPSKAQLKRLGLWEKSTKSKAEQRENRPFNKKRVKIGDG